MQILVEKSNKNKEEERSKKQDIISDYTVSASSIQSRYFDQQYHEQQQATETSYSEFFVEARGSS